jgi:uncharacterized protein (DUF2147 family)
MKKIILTIVLLASFLVTNAQTCFGKWTTYDDKTGKKKSTIELYKYKDQLYGKVVYLYPADDLEENPVCDKCSDDRKNKPIVGLQVARNLKWDGKHWGNGTILDPENGKIYTVKLWLDEKDTDILNVRGYIGPFFRTQTWKRVKD